MEDKSLYTAQTATGGVDSVLATNRVLKNTYMLLSMTLLFSSFTAVASMALNLSHGVGLITSLVAIALLWFVLPRTWIALP